MDFLQNLSQSIQKTLNKNQENNIIQENISNKDITAEEIEIANKLNAIQEYTLDRFENNYAVCEDRNSGEIVNIEKQKLPKDLKEGEIFKAINGKYFKDEISNTVVSERIKNKMNNLWN